VRRVLISGYYGVRNTGDDALLAVSAWGARRMFGCDTRLSATSHATPVFSGADAVRALFPACARFRGERRARLMLEALRAHTVLFGGGSVFHSASMLRQMDHLLRATGRGPHFAVGVSIGPFRTISDERYCARVLRRLAFIGVRDATSKAWADELAPSVPAKLTFDLGPLLPLVEPSSAAHKDRRGIGIALCDYESFAGGDPKRELLRRARIAAALRRLDVPPEDEVVFIDFNGHATLGDRRVHTDIAALAGPRIRARHVTYCDAPRDVLEQVSRLRVIVAMRLHASIFAYVTGTPSLTLSYHPKCEGWASQVGMRPDLVHDSLAFDPAALADQIHAALQNNIPLPALPLAEAQERALGNFPAQLTRPDGGSPAQAV
jgi:polysaccharide pyruvyl transferase WcaK-like protein